MISTWQILDGGLLIDVAEQGDLQSPGWRYPDAPGQAAVEGEFAGKGITEIGEVLDEGVVSQDPLHGPDQGGVKQPRHPAIEPVRHPGVVSLAELEVEGGVDDRIDEPGDDFPPVVQDVAVVQGDRVDIPIREDVAEGHPDGPALAGHVQFEVRIRQLLEQRLHPGTVMPDHPDVNRQNRHDLPDLPELRFGCPAQGEDDFVEIIHSLQFLDDPGHRLPVEFRHERGQQQDHLSFLRDRLQFPLNLLDRPRLELLQGRDDPVLRKVGHLYPPFLFQISIR